MAGAAPASQALKDEACLNGLGLFPMTDRADLSISPLRTGLFGMSIQALWANLALPTQVETQ